MTNPPVARQLPPRPRDNPSLPADLRWYLKLSAYVRDPITLRRKAPLNTAVRYAALGSEEEARMAPALLEYMHGCERALAALGFAPPVRGINSIQPNLRSCFSLLEHPESGTIGFVLVAENAKFEGRYAATATFRTDFADGAQLVTSNSQRVSRTPARPKVEAMRFPEIHDAAALYELHRFRVSARARRVTPVRLTRGPDPISYEERQAATVFDHWVKRGYYERVGPDALRFTRRGAVLASLRGLFPWRQLTDARHRRRAQALLRMHAGA